MKSLVLILALLIFYWGCKKDDEGLKSNAGIVNSLSDSLISPNINENAALTTGKYDLYIDNDTIVDLTFHVAFYSLGREATYSSTIEPKNNFEIALQKSYKYTYSSYNIGSEYITSIDSELINMPKIFNLSDSISDKLQYTSDPIEFLYDEHNSYQAGSWRKVNGAWLKIGYRYIGLVNKTTNIFCFVKISVIDFNKIILRNFKYSKDEDFLIISDK
jgi:hypothetical protein